MSGIIINTSEKGLKLIADNFEISIDPTNEFSGNADIFFISNIHSFNNSLYTHKSPVFIPESIKKLAFYMPPEDEYTISCTPGEKRTLRKHGEKILDFKFIEFESDPIKYAILIQANNETIVYTREITSNPKLLPPCDTLIMNCHHRMPFKSMLENIPEFTVDIGDYSNLYDILDYFNNCAPDNTVGIDHSALDVACHYLKNNCTVFSNTIKPLSHYKKLPAVIITANTQKYTTRPSIPGDLFISQISLSDIYSLSSAVNAKKVIAYCPDFEKTRKRGNLTITGENTIFQI